MQCRIENYWQGEAARYSEHIWRELDSFKKEAWETLIKEYLPQENPLKVLDVGTGPGFFALLLSGMGHRVTAIDCSSNMLKEAKMNIQNAGFHVELLKMDSHALTFPSNTFDVLICRNVTWILQDPWAAYLEWHRVLKPKGRLFIFDANWNLRFHDPIMQKRYEEDQERARQLGIKRVGHVDPEEGDKIARELFFSKHLRPQWDAEALINIGFPRLWIDADISERIWDKEENILYRSTPMFLICAEK
ncbi:class I SAM-dependent methyltransferase [Candidatus Formimonas warabiya]|uniref:Methyltransferase type 11 n=1 Tax=Formimonas warabiya TaxID=1761012 RepID=A0A3G1KZH0_FORW1|nr:class I SAM-dependent methyltransferase [Candidatus Formimonas warabiya]ATW27635.1 methyltransferase type 11 [Candidatus Formimonas warabiya]